mmetsp:Transcript_9787/g.14716  ORF Transcript_9787/g.14716 Transcript_9787/m.14716 type:complete len:99 (-) Transcript_9787:30-326(-)
MATGAADSSVASARPGTANTQLSTEKAADRRVTTPWWKASSVLDAPTPITLDEEEGIRASALHVHGISASTSDIDIVNFIRSAKQRLGYEKCCDFYVL